VALVRAAAEATPVSRGRGFERTTRDEVAADVGDMKKATRGSLFFTGRGSCAESTGIGHHAAGNSVMAEEP
jgi:hypothetical protein